MRAFLLALLFMASAVYAETIERVNLEQGRDKDHVKVTIEFRTPICKKRS